MTSVKDILIFSKEVYQKKVEILAKHWETEISLILSIYRQTVGDLFSYSVSPHLRLRKVSSVWLLKRSKVLTTEVLSHLTSILHLLLTLIISKSCVACFLNVSAEQKQHDEVSLLISKG